VEHAHVRLQWSPQRISTETRNRASIAAPVASKCPEPIINPKTIKAIQAHATQPKSRHPMTIFVGRLDLARLALCTRASRGPENSCGLSSWGATMISIVLPHGWGVDVN
jgi:hypothetical protein